MASMLQVSDLNNQAVSAGKKLVHERRFLSHGSGLEAPRSIPLEAPPDVSRERFMRPEDVPFGFQLHKTQLSAVATRSAKEGPTVQSMAAPIFSGELESKRRAPSVVAQLMGLDSLPDELFPPAPRKSCHEPARAYVEASQLPYKENRPFLLRQQSQGSAPASMWLPPLPKNMHRRTFSQDNKADQEPETPVRILPSQDHPGKKQLQQFKKEFSVQSGSQSQGPEWPQTVQLTDMNQQLEEKKNQVRATLDQARLALVQGNMSNQNCQLTCEEFQESKEFLNAMNFLQCNKEFFFEFLQQKPDTVFSQRLLEPGSWGLTECVTQLKPLKKARGQEKSCTEGTTERKREAFSPRAFSFQFLESLKPHDSKSQQGKTVDGNETKLSVGSHHEASQCNSSCSRSRIVEADLSPSNVVHPKSRLTEIKSSAKDSMSLKLSRNLVDDGRDCVKDNAQLLVEEVKQKAKQWDRDQRRDEMRYAGQIRGSSNDSTKVGQDIARQAQDANSFAIANDSSRYEVSLSRNTLTGKRVTINRKDIEGSNVTTCNKAGDGALTPTLKPLREHVGRSCTSLPNSPRLAHKPDLTVATKKKKTYVIGKAKALLPDCGDAGLKLKVGADDFVAPMHSGVVEAKCVGESPKPGSLTHVRNVQNSKSAVPSEIIVAEKNALSQPCRAEATSTINANCQNTVMKPEGGHGRPGSQRLRIEAKESSQRDRRPMKCHSAHNTALPCHEQGQSSDGSRRKKPTISLGPQRKPNQKFVRKALVETTKAASSKNTQSQAVEKRRGLLLVDRKKTGNTVNQHSSANHHTQPYSPSPVVAHVVQLVKSRLLQNSVLVDADCVNNGGSHVKGPSVEANSPKPSAKGTSLKRPSPFDKSISADTHAGACVYGEQESLERMSQVMSQAPCQVGVEPATAECSHVTTPVALHEVEPRKQPRTLRPWSMTHNVVDRANEAADLTCDKHEQPSPVSVLQSPFEEESPSPLEFKDITNNFRGGDYPELRIQLNLSNVDGSDRLKADMENVPPEDHDFADSPSARVQPRIHSSTPLIPSLRESKTKSRETTESNLIDNFLPKSLSVFDSLGLRKALCSRRWEDDLTYICNVLHSSGFVDETGSALSMPHSLTQPLGQPIFERLEACYPSSKRESSNRQVLFDAINEILFRKAAPCNLQPWLALKASPPPIGKKIVEEIWLEICNQGFYLQHKDLHDDYLESLVAQDIMNSGMWISLHEDMDSISVKLEHTIFNDLVEEVIQNLISSY